MLQVTVPALLLQIVYLHVRVHVCQSQMSFPGVRSEGSGSMVETRSTLGPQPCNYNYKRKSAMCAYKRLHYVPDNLLEDTRELDLGYNEFHTLSNTSFLRYTLLVDLALRYNDIVFIDEATFYPLKHLYSLDLRSNQNIQFPSTDIFVHSEKLAVLSLSTCNLINIPYGLLMPLHKLQKLYLTYNGISFIDFSPCPFGEMDEMALSDNHIQEITPDAFKFACKSTDLLLHRNPIHTINSDTIAGLQVEGLSVSGQNFSKATWRDLFKGIAHSSITRFTISYTDLNDVSWDFFLPLQNHSLLAVYLRWNDLEFLDQFNFASLPNLQNLCTGFNKIRIIEPTIFEGMDALRVLSLKRNEIKHINLGNATWNVPVSHLDLSWNEMIVVTEHTFHGLENLSYLDLSRNYDLTSLEMGSFGGLKNLQLLNVSLTNVQVLSMNAPLLRVFRFQTSSYDNNAIVPGEAFRQTQALEQIEITSSISTINLLSPNRTSLFKGLKYLQTLLLTENKFDSLPTGIFSTVDALEVLDLSKCQISVLSPKVFSGLKSLVILSLKNNNIQHLPLLAELFHLTLLHLDSNKLNYLNTDAFVDTPNLSQLTLSNNFFTGFNQSTFHPVASSLSAVDVSGNSLECNCHAKWLISWLKTSSVTFLQKAETFCSSSPATLEPVRSKSLVVFEPNKLCAPNITLYACISLAIFALFSISVIGFHFRWWISYKIFLLRLAILGYEEIADARDHTSFDYDLHVVFTNDTAMWVQEHLHPFLEKRVPHLKRNAFGDEDLKPGMHYLDAVDHLVVSSFKTVLVLSREAVQDNWFLIKCRMVMDHSNDTQMDNTVLVFLEDIPEQELPNVLKIYLRDHRPYLYWTEDEEDHEYFWNKFVKHLTVNLMYNPLIPAE